MVFWRVTGTYDEEDDVEAREIREAGWSIVATDIMLSLTRGWP